MTSIPPRTEPPKALERKTGGDGVAFVNAGLALPERVTPAKRVSYTWGKRQFSLMDADEGFYRISGITGSGKSHILKLFILEALQEVEHNPHAKLVLYEPKREFFAWLASLGLKSKITYFFPSDARSSAMDFDHDYPDDDDATTLAHAFFPQKPASHESEFWGNTLRTIFAGVYTAIRAKVGRVDLRLVFRVLEDEELTRKGTGDSTRCSPR